MTWLSRENFKHNVDTENKYTIDRNNPLAGVLSMESNCDVFRKAHMRYIFHKEYAAAISKMSPTIKNGAMVVRISFERGEKSMVHSGRNESILNVNVFRNSNADSMMGGQLTPLNTPSLSVERPAIKRTHANDCNPDRISFMPLAAATKGGKVRDDDNTASKINKTMAMTRMTTSLDSGHLVQTKFSL